MPEMAARTVRVEDLDSRTPTPVRALDLYAVLAAAALACVVYVGALLTGVALAPGAAAAAVAAAPVCAAFALALLWQRSRREAATASPGSRPASRWRSRPWRCTSSPCRRSPRAAVRCGRGPSPGRHCSCFPPGPGLGAAAGALGAPARWRWPATGAGVLVALLVAGTASRCRC